MSTGGLVGIGTALPAEKLEVAGNIRINSSGYLDFYGTNAWRIGNGNDGGAASTTLSVRLEPELY